MSAYDSGSDQHDAFCCVGGSHSTGRDCPVLSEGAMGASIIGYLKTGEHVGVARLGGESNQFWQLDRKFSFTDDFGDTTYVQGWVPKGHLEFFSAGVKKSHEEVCSE